MPNLPGAAPDTLLLQWCAFVGLLAFVTVLLARHNVWGILKDADPTGITMTILAVFTGATFWCGRRCHVLAEERRALDAWISSHRQRAGRGLPAALPLQARHTTDYLQAVERKRSLNHVENGQLTDVLAERLHGPSEGAWWVNGIQIKLGLLGKVIGFSILALQISQIESFDPSQTQTLLKSLTGGLGVALLTTAVGLVANILLGFQLVRLDRCADAILADALYFVETDLQSAAR
ncbi:MAG: hypothetical protein H7327_14195 [Herminiimonas sp.]|nr:hypothetical protein [Herminiimonas sp.]